MVLFAIWYCPAALTTHSTKYGTDPSLKKRYRFEKICMHKWKKISNGYQIIWSLGIIKSIVLKILLKWFIASLNGRAKRERR